MKKIKVITLLLTVSAAPMVFSGGDHDHMHDSGNSHLDMAHWMAPDSEAARKNPVKATVESIKKGAQLYQQNCVSCHGANADGNGMAGMMLNPRPSNLRVMSGTHSDGDFAYKIREGRGAMPSWKKSFNEEQIWNLVNFIQSLSSQPASIQVKDTGKQHSHDHQHTH